MSEDDKAFKICNVLGGLDITRLVSSNTRSFFGGAIDDVEFVREFVSTAAKHGGIAGGISTLRELNLTLDWEARGFSNATTTTEAGLGYVDDRSDRTIERYVSYANEPLVGDKESDLAILNSVSLVFPWIVDRKSHEANWWLEHQNGRSEDPSKEPFLFDSLYTAAWIGTYGDVWSYYPPFRVWEHPFNFADLLTENYDSHEEEFVRPNLPENNPSRKAFFTKPYPDTAVPGLSLITAMAPIYYTGTFRNNTYSDTYLASTGLDIAVSSVSTLLDVLENKLTRQSFGILVDSDFNIIVISQTAVEMVYPARTGFEETRVTYDLNDGSIVTDRRNQTYLVSDTILQPLTALDNADWTSLLSSVRQVDLGRRGYDILPITLTGQEPDSTSGESSPTDFYVMYERWQYVADWALLVFAPVNEVTSAIDVHVYGESYDRTIQPKVSLESGKGDVVTTEALITNHGSLDVIVRPKTIPRWIQLPANDTVLKAGESFSVEFDVLTSELEIGSSFGVMTFNIQDHQYPDCFYNEDLTFEVAMRVTAQDCKSSRVIDSAGNCVCEGATMGGSCVPYGVLAASIVLPLIAIALIAAFLYLNKKRKQAESVWAVKADELHFDDPPQVIGRGTFGLVLLGEYRGTKVAVKRVIPPRERRRSVQDSRATSSDAKVSPVGSGLRSAFGEDLFEFQDRTSNTHLDTTLTKESEREPRPPRTKRRLSNPKGVERAAGVIQAMESGVYRTRQHGVANNDEKTSSSSMKGGSKSGLGSIPGLSSAVSGRMMTAKASQASWLRKILGYGDEYTKLKADFIEEMKLLSKLRHPCITTVMGAVIEKGKDPMLIMEYMDHGSLSDVLLNETMVIDGEVVLPILRDVAHGLRFLHAATPQVIHGDLKAQNVLVDIKFRAKVADFGLSQKKAIGATGTPLWMAPELLRGESENTAASDVYSFGIILYEVYARKEPYEGEDFREVLRQVQDVKINKRPPVPPQMPPAIVALMCDCLVPDPNTRPSFDEIDKRLNRLSVESIEPGQTGIAAKSTKAHEAQLNENLLLNVFPKHIAEALREGRKPAPEHHDCVTIFFSDIVGFTTLAGSISPMKVADLLDRLYLSFDYLSDEHGVFKVETIGDAWMGVTNLVSDQTDHAKRIAEFAIDAIEAAGKTLIDLENPDLGYVQIRVGFHSGPVLSNVVGSRNPHFTIFGDTVNTSSRMESNSAPGRIHCSERAADLLAMQSSIPILYRGEIDIKGKGAMKTYWVNESSLLLKD